MPRRTSNRLVSTLCVLGLGACLALPAPVAAKKKDKQEQSAYAPALPPPAPVPVAATEGAIFRGSYTPLTSGMRASQIGDVLTIQLVERTNASLTNSTGTDRNGSIGLAPPTTGPLSIISSSDVNMGGTQSFKGKGDAVQANSLSGDITVTIAEVYANGTMLVRGEKRLSLNRGDEVVQVSGIIRSADISTDNRIPSWRVADAKINYKGKGDIARASRQGWLQRFFSIISPF